jgi:asparaginyl-tRNA synthetase
MAASDPNSIAADRFAALIDLRASALREFRAALEDVGYCEVTLASLVNVAGSCENPIASFTLPYYGREAHLSQSAQLQLESLVLRLRRGFYTVNTSFRAEHYDDPADRSRRLSEFTLIEPEAAFPGLPPDAILDRLVAETEDVIRRVVNRTAAARPADLTLLRSGRPLIELANGTHFARVTYDEAVALLARDGTGREPDSDLGIADEQRIMSEFGGRPVFVTHFPADLKFFNLKRTADGRRAYSFDLLLPPLGEAVGGGVREENGRVIGRQLDASRIGEYLRTRGQNPLGAFAEYFGLLDACPPTMRGGFGAGFERFLGFLLGSADILDTIRHRTLRP